MSALYADTSSLLKVILPVEFDFAVALAIASEATVVLSSLVELEARVQLRARYLGGILRRIAFEQAVRRLERLKIEDPFEIRQVPASLFTTALRQHEDSTGVHLRSLDRLHLAAMEEFGITRLLTHDRRQAEAARELGFEVLSPL